jgi:hypothetical protein
MNARDDRHGRQRRGVEKEKGRSKARTTENEERADGGRGKSKAWRRQEQVSGRQSNAMKK